MGATENLTYENFIRDAFSMATGKEVGRWGDPASLANTDVFDVGELHLVKAGISYSMLIFNSILRNDYSDHPIVRDSVNYNRQDSIVQDVLNAPNKMSIYSLINEYTETYYPAFKK
jgi:hypothetical protein